MSTVWVLTAGDDVMVFDDEGLAETTATVAIGANLDAELITTTTEKADALVEDFAEKFPGLRLTDHRGRHAS